MGEKPNRGQRGIRSSDPSPEQIQKLCVEIRAGWDRAEAQFRRGRLAYDEAEAWEPPTVRVPMLERELAED